VIANPIGDDERASLDREPEPHTVCDADASRGSISVVGVADRGDRLGDVRCSEPSGLRIARELLVERAPDELTTRPDGLASIIRAIAA
jgi:hypothetical protein